MVFMSEFFKFKKGDCVRLRDWETLKRNGFKLFNDEIIHAETNISYLPFRVYQKKINQEYIVVQAKYSKIHHEALYSLKFPITFMKIEAMVDFEIQESLLEFFDSANTMESLEVESFSTPEKREERLLFSLAKEFESLFDKLEKYGIEFSVTNEGIYLSEGRMGVKISR